MQTRRFVIQEHSTAEGIHWDLMLEQDKILTTFRLEEAPSEVLHHAIRAVKIFDHPLRFLTYEGPVQKGTGHVRLTDSGTYRLTGRDDDTIGLAMEGRILTGRFTLTRDRDQHWLFAAGSGESRR